jgi:glycogen synthase
LQRVAMALDFSWDASARAYVEAYERARANVAGRQGVTA